MIIDELKILDGYIDENRFIMRGIGENAVYGAFKADGLLAMSRLLGEQGEEFRFVIDKEKSILINAEDSITLYRELRLIADALETLENE